MTARGRPGFAFPGNGGAVRDIDKERIHLAYLKAFKIEPATETLERIEERFKFRIIEVDNPVKTFTKKDLEQVNSAAKKLQSAIKEFPASNELLNSVQWRLGRRFPREDFLGWLMLLQKIDSHQPLSSADGYRSTIRFLQDVCAEEGYERRSTGGAAFKVFLTELAEVYPGLVFPTSAAPQAREQYVRDALKGNSAEN